MKKITILLILTFSVLISCQQKSDLNNIVLSDLKGNFFSLDSLLNPVCSVIIFFSPECPLSENYTLTSNTLFHKYSSDSIQFIGIIPGKQYNMEEINKFQTKYNLLYPIYLDEEKELTNYLGANITPECFVLNKNKNVIYHGAIDNWAVDLGKKRTLVTEHYLNDAIQHVLNAIAIDKTYVEAVGCYIE